MENNSDGIASNSFMEIPPQQEYKMEGILIYDGMRPDIAFYNGTTYGGLHCGDCFLCFTGGKWSSVRLEWDDGWKLWQNGCLQAIQYGAIVKMTI